MNWWQRLSQRAKQEQQLDRELQFHIEARISDLRGAGLSEEDARRRVRQEFGGAAQVKEDCRDARGTRWLEDFFKDVRFATRQMRRTPGFATVAVLTLALGIGANTAIFTLVNAVLMKSLPVRDPARLLLLGNSRNWGVITGQTGSFSVFSYDLYRHLRDNSGVFEGLCAFQSLDIRINARRSGTGTAEPAGVKLVSGNYFEVLGVTAALGRTITPSDDSAAAPVAAVVSFRYWNEKLNRNPSVIGSTVELGGVPAAIIGVAAPEFFGETLQPDPPDLWLPISAERQLNPQRSVIDSPDSHWLFLMGRLKPGIANSQAEGRLTAALRNWLGTRDIPAEWRRDAGKSYIELTPGGSGITHMKRRYAEMLRLLLGASVLVLLIASINVTNLLLARGTTRSGETSVRLALGASRGRLIRQSLTESLMLALTGAAFGLLIASAGAKLLIALAFRGAEYVPIRTAPDLGVLVFTGAVSLGVALGFGLFPAVRCTRSDLAPVLRGVTQSIRGSVLSRRGFGVGQALIIGQMALSLVLLAGAGLFARSLANLTRQQFGFAREHVLVAGVAPGFARYQYHQLGSLYQRLYSRLNSVPGVRSAAFSLYAPFTSCCWSSGVSIQGYTPQPKERMFAVWNRVSPRYFETLGTKVLLGRPIDERDTPAARHVAVVTEAFVRRYFPNTDPIGRRFGIGDDSHRSDLEIVGVVENAKYNSPREEPRPMAFLPLLQVRPQPGEPLQSAQIRSNFVQTVEVRAAGDPNAIAGDVRQALAEIDPHLPVLRINTLSSQIARTLSQENAVSELTGFFGLSALLLACCGLYGLTAYAVERRTSEIGIRMALGARRGLVIGMVIREVLVQGIAGIVIGVAGAIAATRLIANQLYGIEAADPATLATAALTLLVCITMAGYIPARRASRIDPIRALRHE